MNPAVTIHEGFMNDSRTILPRVGVGVGVRGDVGHPCLSSHWGRVDGPHMDDTFGVIGGGL